MDASAIQQQLAASPFSSFMGLQVKALRDGVLVIRMPVRAELIRGGGANQVHGGAVATLIDVVGDYAVAAVLGGPVPTVHLAVEFLKPASGDWLDATGSVRRKGRTLSTVDIEVHDPEGALVAIGRAIYMNV